MSSVTSSPKERKLLTEKEISMLVYFRFRCGSFRYLFSDDCLSHLSIGKPYDKSVTKSILQAHAVRRIRKKSSQVRIFRGCAIFSSRGFRLGHHFGSVLSVVICSKHAYPGRRFALPWAISFWPFGADGSGAGQRPEARGQREQPNSRKTLVRSSAGIQGSRKTRGLSPGIS